MSAIDEQVGGGHYKQMPIQPFEFTAANDLGGLEHTVVKYISRWPQKGGIEDIRKCRHTLQFLQEKAGSLIEIRSGRPMPYGITPTEYSEANNLGRFESDVVFWVWIWQRNRLECALGFAIACCEALIHQELSGEED